MAWSMAQKEIFPQFGIKDSVEWFSPEQFVERFGNPSQPTSQPSESIFGSISAYLKTIAEYLPSVSSTLATIRDKWNNNVSANTGASIVASPIPDESGTIDKLGNSLDNVIEKTGVTVECVFC